MLPWSRKVSKEQRDEERMDNARKGARESNLEERVWAPRLKSISFGADSSLLFNNVEEEDELVVSSIAGAREDSAA